MSIAIGVGGRLSPAQDAAISKSIPKVSGITSIALVGDSNTAFMLEQAPTVTAIVDNLNNTATVSFSGSHNFAVGQSIYVNNSTERKFNVFGAEITAIVNSGTFTVTYILGGRTSPVVSGVAASTQVLYGNRYSPLGYGTWLETFQRKWLNYTHVCAGGADSKQALEIYNDALNELLDKQVSDVIVLIGGNDIYSRGNSFTQVKTDLTNLLTRITTTLNARIWVLTPIPLNSAAAAWSAGKQTVHNQIIRWLWEYTQQLGVTCIDSWRTTQNGLTFVNAGAANPDATANFLGADNTHTTNLGALALATKLDEYLSAVQTTRWLEYQGVHAAIQNQNNILTNSRLTGSGGTVTAGTGTIVGTAPTSWTLEITSGTGTVTATSPARTVAVDGDADGNNLQLIPSVNAVTFRILQSGFHASVTVGQEYDIFWPITITGAASLSGIELILFGTKSSGGNENVGIVGTSQVITGAFTGVLRIPRWVARANLTSLSLFLRFTFGAAPGGTIIVGHPSMLAIQLS